MRSCLRTTSPRPNLTCTWLFDLKKRGWIARSCYGKTPYESSGVAKFPLIKHGLPGKPMHIFPPIFHIILFAASPKVPENFRGKYTYLYSKINILSKEIWQLSNLHTAFLLSLADLYPATSSIPLKNLVPKLVD